MKKSIYLFLALVFPIIIFLFLKQFGKNEFNVDALLKQPEAPIESCDGYTYKFPYTIADSTLNKLGWINSDTLTLFAFDESTKNDSHERTIQLARVLKEISGTNYRIIYHSNFDYFKTLVNDKRFNTINDSLNFSNIKPCAFWLKHFEDVVLVNSRKEILGKYSLLNREDSDRLILEMKIVLRQY